MGFAHRYIQLCICLCNVFCFNTADLVKFGFRGSPGGTLLGLWPRRTSQGGHGLNTHHSDRHVRFRVGGVFCILPSLILALLPLGSDLIVCTMWAVEVAVTLRSATPARSKSRGWFTHPFHFHLDLLFITWHLVRTRQQMHAEIINTLLEHMLCMYISDWG